MLRRFYILFIGLFCCTACDTVAPAEETVLWYARPASEWMQALPLGNGRIGAMVYGGVGEEKIALNEITLWSGAPDPHQQQPCGKKRLKDIRELFFQGKLLDGNVMATRYLSGTPHSFGSHLPLGDLKFRFEYPDTSFRDYHRELDLGHALAGVSYRVGDVGYVREVFCSNPDQVLAVRFRADRKGALTFTVEPDLLRRAEVYCDGDDLVFGGRATFRSPDEPGVNFSGRVKIMTKGGTVAADGGCLSVRQADEAVVLVDIRTDYTGIDPAAVCAATLEKAVQTGYDTLKKRHTNDYAPLFDRVALSLGGDEKRRGLPTDVRWQEVREGKDDPGLMALFVQYGRYLLIASSRQDSPLPANLQGIWNDNLACSMSWNCDYHLDINTQQNYWAANVANLPECNAPLVAFLESLVGPGSRTATEVYGSPGWVAHTVVNAWGYTAPGDGVGWGLHPTAGVWLALHLWDHYNYTGDTVFLKERGYPVLKKSARFFLDYLVCDPASGYLMTGPSTSPENAFRYEGETLALSMMPTCDRVLVHELFASCIESARVLQIDGAFADSLKQALEQLPPFRIGKYGQLQEWFADYEEAVPNHRHTSHLLALYPYAQISVEKTPGLARAAETTLERRMASGNWEDVEWSRANMVNFYARLKNPDKAYYHMQGLLRELTGENLLTISPKGIGGAPWDIFVFDGNEAGAAGVLEMLLQSQEGYIEFLPALPDVWHSGYFRGLCVRGGGKVDLDWKDGKLKSARFCAGVSGPVRIRLADSGNLRFVLNGREIRPLTRTDEIICVEMEAGDILGMHAVVR